MLPETQQKILNTLERALTDVRDWLDSLHVPIEHAASMWEQVIAENGMLAKLISHMAAAAFPLRTEVAAPLATFEQAVRRIRSPEFAEFLLSQPEPPPEEVARVLEACRNAIPNVAASFEVAGKAGPSPRRGGRRKLLTDPAERDKICAEIKQRRGPGVTLERIFKSLGKRYDVSDTTIKRIWLDCAREDPGNTEV